MTWWRSQRSEAPGISFRVEQEHRARPDVRMDLACFVGLTERGPLGRAVACDSWDDYLLRFGRRGAFRQVAEGVHQFFVNGGRRCVVVRTVGADAPTALWTLRGVARWGGGDARLHAHDPGAWGDDVDPVLQPRLRPIQVSRVSNTELMGADSLITAGSVLYFEKQNAFRVVQAVDGTAWQLTSSVFGTWASADGRLPRVYEVTLDFVANHGDRTERFTGLGLDVRHPRWAMQVIADQSWLVYPDALLLSVLPVATPTLRPDLEGPWDSSLTTPAVHDGESSVTRETFFSRVPLTIFRWADGPDPFEAMRIWDEGSADDESTSRELEPVTQVILSDLVHPGVYHPSELLEDDESEPEPTLRFEVCSTEVAEPEDSDEAPPGSPYLALEVGADYVDVVRRIARQCEADGRIALVDIPTTYAANDVMGLRNIVVSRRVAFYGPWLRVENEDGSLWRLVGATGAVAGIIAARERQNGMAGIPGNVELKGILDLWEPATLPDDAFLHALRINRVRYDWGTYRLMGSRVAIDDATAGHVNVQRLLLYLHRQLTIDGRFAVFQPNNERLWAQLYQRIERRLTRLHNKGALAGANAAQAFRIKIDKETNPLHALDQGILRAYIGVAPSVPTEFIDVVFKLVANRGLEVTDG